MPLTGADHISEYEARLPALMSAFALANGLIGPARRAGARPDAHYSINLDVLSGIFGLGVEELSTLRRPIRA